MGFAMSDVFFVKGLNLRRWVQCSFALFLPVFLLTTIRGYASILPASRMVDWTNYPPGVQGGIPDRTVVFTNMVMNSTGATDVSSNLNAAIAACPPNEVVFIPKGTYLITNTIEMKSYVVLRGAGMYQTTLVFSNGAGENGIEWPLPSTLDIYYPNYAPAQSNDVYSGSLRGSTNLTLVGGEPYTANYVPGRICLIDETNDPSLFGGSLEHYGYMGRLGGSRMMKQLIQILTVTDGTNVTFRPPLVWDYTNQPQLVYLPAINQDSGVEDLCVTNSWPTNEVPDWTGTNYTSIGGNTINFDQTVNCWAKNVAIRREAYAGINLYYAFDCTVEGCDVRYSYDYVNPNHSYAILLANGTSDCLIENNIIYGNRSGILCAGCGARNVIAYNYAPHNWVDNYGMIITGAASHGGEPWFNLWEGNVVSGFAADLFHGGSSYNILFRNWAKGWDPGGCSGSTNYYERAVLLCASNYYYSIVGNVLGDPALVNPQCTNTWTYMSTTNNSHNEIAYIYRLGPQGTGEGTAGWDPRVAQTTFIDGNYDYATHSTIWNSNGVQKLPPSLYLTSKPTWWSNSVPWPPIGPDISPMTNAIPAELRFEASASPTTSPPSQSIAPSPPSGLMVLGVAQ